MNIIGAIYAYKQLLDDRHYCVFFFILADSLSFRFDEKGARAFEFYLVHVHIIPHLNVVMTWYLETMFAN